MSDGKFFSAKAIVLRDIVSEEALRAAKALIGAVWSCVALEVEQQKALNWCWAALGVSLGRFFDRGFSLTQCELVQVVRSIKGCCEKPLPSKCDVPEDFERVLRTPSINRFDRIEDPPEEFTQVALETAQQRPVTFLLDSRRYPERVRHYVVVTCCRTDGKEQVEVVDPVNGHTSHPSFAELKRNSCCSFHVT